MVQFPWITVVSGLPRSGTSLMMQALVAGGLEPLADDQRLPDESNPRGYLEFEPVKRMKSDISWLAQAQGKAVKIVHLLLPELFRAAGEFQFRVIMMRRPIGEIVASQRAMLTRQGRPIADLSDQRLSALFTDQMKRVESQLAGRAEFQVMSVDYPALVENPITEMVRVDEFLGGGLDKGAMALAVDPALYRERRHEG